MDFYFVEGETAEEFASLEIPDDDVSLKNIM